MAQAGMGKDVMGHPGNESRPVSRQESLGVQETLLHQSLPNNEYEAVGKRHGLS